MAEDMFSDYLTLSLCSNSALDFFSIDAVNHIIWRELLLECYSQLVSEKYRDVDEGIIQTRLNNSEIQNIGIVLEDTGNDIWWDICYSEKRRKVYLALSSDDRVFIGRGDSEPKQIRLSDIEIVDLDFEKQYDICLSPPMRDLLNDLILLKKSEIGNGEKHPFYKSTYSDCSNHLKLLCLFCGCYGFKAAQMIEILELAKMYEASSFKLIKALSIIRRLSFDERKELLKRLDIWNLSENKTIIICDCLYMLKLGGYHCDKTDEAIQLTADLLGLSKNTAYKIYNEIIRRIEQ